MSSRPSPSLSLRLGKRWLATSTHYCANNLSNKPSRRTPNNKKGQPPPRRKFQQQPSDPLPLSEQSQGPNDKVSNALQLGAQNDQNNLMAPVHIPDDPYAILKLDHPATSILANSSIVVQRKMEFMNVMLGFEQANKYVIMDATGNHIGYLAEQEHGMGNAIARQAFKTHRSFTTHVFDKGEKEVLRFHRPFSWISSRIRVYDATNSSQDYATSDTLNGSSVASVVNQSAAHVASKPLSDMRIIGEAQQEWAPLRRKYNLFLQRDLSNAQSDASKPQLPQGDLPMSGSKALQVPLPANESIGLTQFAYVDEPFLSWDFSLMSKDKALLGSVNRNFAGFAREIFTDTGVYALRMDSAGLNQEPGHILSQSAVEGQAAQTASSPNAMTLDQRAVMLATAVSVDFDYFSRTRGPGGMGFMPLWFPMGGGGAPAENGTAAEADAGGAAGAGTMAGSEAAQSGGLGSSIDDASPQASQGFDKPPEGFQNDTEEFWDPWKDGGSATGSGGSRGGNNSGGEGEGTDGGGDGGSWFEDFFG